MKCAWFGDIDQRHFHCFQGRFMSPGRFCRAAVLVALGSGVLALTATAASARRTVRDGAVGELVGHSGLDRRFAA
jgi:hypothetical protein